LRIDNTPNASAVYTQAADFLAALFRDAPDDQLLEFRIIGTGGPVQKYHQIGELKANGFGAALPTHYDGRANVYFGVATRTRREGTADAVGAATAIWFDEWTRPADLLPMSWILETSPNKVQGGYLLKEATNDLARVERLNKRLGQAVGGDKVFDRARVLRLPGFLNVKPEHPEHPRAQLQELNLDLRYTLEELEAALPELTETDQDRPLREHAGPFTPHSGTPLAESDQARLGQFLKDDLGLRRQYDGRYAGPCPLPHQDGPSTSESNFYISPITGRFKCFGSLHIGNDTGGIDALRLIGFDLALPDDAWLRKLTDTFGSDWLGVDEPEPFKRKVGVPSVGNLVLGNFTYTNKPTLRGKRPKKRDSVWEQSLDLFPKLRGVKATGKSRAGYSFKDGAGYFWDAYSNTWRNPQNAQWKRRQNYKNLTPVLNGRGPWFRCDYSLDSYPEERQAREDFHDRLRTYVHRKRGEEGYYIGIDNLHSKGFFTCLINVLPGQRSQQWKSENWVPEDNPEQWLIEGLKGIRPPRHDDKSMKQFQPIFGTKRIKAVAEKAVDEDQNRINLVATSDEPTDPILLEATGRVHGLSLEFKNNASLFRSQCSDYFMKVECTLDQFLDLVEGMEGYKLTKFAREELAESLKVAAAA